MGLPTASSARVSSLTFTSSTFISLRRTRLMTAGLRAGFCAGVVLASLTGAAAQSAPASPPTPAPASASATTTSSQPATDLDALMEKVLERRAESWRRLQEYVLDEQEKFELLGPGDVRLLGQQRNYSWYVRDGYLIRSPVKFNGVALSETDRRKYEADWLNDEKEREQSQQEKRLQRAKEKEARARGGAAGPFDTGAPVQAGVDDILREGGVEPRFISESYFLGFKFEPGNYYLVGRERLDNQDVLKIEYYPRKRMFDGMEEHDRDEHARAEAKAEAEAAGKAGAQSGKKVKEGKKSARAEQFEEDMERKFNKVSLVTLWVDPAERQIVKYTFDLPDFGFLPGRWAVRADDAQAAMTMGQPVSGVWLPKELSVAGGFTLASGGYRFKYSRAFLDYKLGDVRAKIRGYETRER